MGVALGEWGACSESSVLEGPQLDVGPTCADCGTPALSSLTSCSPRCFLKWSP